MTIKEISEKDFEGVIQKHNYHITEIRCPFCVNVDNYGGQLICTLHHEPVSENGICDVYKYDWKNNLEEAMNKGDTIENQIEHLKEYLETTDIDIEDITFGELFICLKTINIEIDKDDLRHISSHPQFKYIQAEKENLNLLFRRW